MNGLTPKISRGGAKNSKNDIIGSPIDIKSFPQDIADKNYSSVKKFLNAASVDEQLGILKNIVEEQKVSNDNRVVEFLAIVFYEAPAKHPLKCFLARHVTKSSSIQEPFTEFLSSHILAQIDRNKEPYKDYEYYADVVPKVVLCLENFPAGVAALESVDVKLLIRCFFLNYFECFRRDIRNSSIFPITKKTEIFVLEHLILRLLVHIIQKLNPNQDYKTNEWADIFQSIACCVEELIIDEEVPMDTKSLSGILLLSVETLRWTGDVWEALLESTGDHASFHILRYKAGQLAVYSAIATTVTMEKLQEQGCGGTAPAILILIDRLLNFADGSGTEAAQTLCVARSLLHLSKSLGAIRPALRPALGPRAVSSLLAFVWPHLEFHLDSVRHLTQQILTNALGFCAELEKSIDGVPGDPLPLPSLLEALRARGRRRSLYWTAASAARVLGAARVLRQLCPASELLDAAADSHLHAAVCVAISALISASTGDSGEVFATWVSPALARPAARDAVLAAALTARPDIADLISQRVRGAALLACCGAAPQCRARLSHAALRAAAVHKDEETRLRALSLVCAAARSTQAAPRAELRLVLSFLRYNINAPQPAFRHAVLDNVKKLLKRLEDSYRVLRRRAEPGRAGEHYVEFVECLRRLCYCAAQRGANHGRRSAALQLLAVAEPLHLAPHHWVWKEEYVETLLLLLDDSYDTNKELALQLLQHCPEHMLMSERFQPRLDLSRVVRGAGSRRPAHCAAAAYKLRLLLTRAPARLTAGNERLAQGYTGDPAWLPHYVLLKVLLEELEREGYERWGGFGLLHCIAVLLREDLREAAWQHTAWAAAARACVRAGAAAAARALPAVAAAAPEGHLPRPYSDTSMEDGEPITSQMVLVCAWRTIKESSLVLGWAGGVAGGGAARAGRRLVRVLARARHRGAVEQAAAGLQVLAERCWSSETLRPLPRAWLRWVVAAARAATSVTRRGAGLPAAVQALVSSELTVTGRADCFHECMALLLRQATSDDAGAPSDGAPSDGALSDSAPNDAAFSDGALSDDDFSDEDSCDGAPDDDAPSDSAAVGAARRALAANILRALYRHSALESVARAHVAAGLRVAICGFDAAAWTERTAMSLLFAALAARAPAARAFPHHQPQLHALMLSKLEEAERSEGAAGGGSAHAALLLLARLGRAARDERGSGLKLAPLVPPVRACARSRVLTTRRRAAAALRALVAANDSLFFSHIEQMFVTLADRGIARNHCHGVLLQLGRLLETPPEHPGAPGLPLTPGAPTLPVGPTVWLLAQAVGSRPCYVIAKEYAYVINLLVWRFPELIPDETVSATKTYLEDLLFTASTPLITIGRELCLADCLCLYLILLHLEKNQPKITEVTLKALQHKCYEVVLAALNYLLILHQELDIEDCPFQKHLNSVCDETILEILRKNSDYVSILTKGYNGAYLECKNKCLKLLSLENDTQLAVINKAVPSDCVNRNEWIVEELIKYTKFGHENVTHMYLDSLLKFTSEKLGNSSLDCRCVLDVASMVYARSSPDNSGDSRLVVVGYLEKNVESMMKLDLSKLHDAEKFRYRATVLATLVTLLEDDDDDIRQRAADVAARLAAPVVLGDVALKDVEPGDVTPGDVTPEDAALGDGTFGKAALARVILDSGGDGVVASLCSELLRDYVESLEDSAALFVLLALLDFESEVCMTDELSEECRVFDQSERYNIFLEETVWTSACAEKLIKINQQKDANLIDNVLSIAHDKRYVQTFEMLCKDNFSLFIKMAKEDVVKEDTMNPKIELFVHKLRGL